LQRLQRFSNDPGVPEQIRLPLQSMLQDVPDDPSQIEDQFSAWIAGALWDAVKAQGGEGLKQLMAFIDEQVSQSIEDVVAPGVDRVRDWWQQRKD
jgi:hypothetical protein